MKANFKQIGLVTAIAAVTAGYTSVAGAQAVRSSGNLGDLGVIPYYSVQDDWATGVHIINTSASTQVIKIRLRRASDSADALDFNLILSPADEWTGSLDNSSGNTIFSTDDNSCTAPLRADGQFAMPAIFALGAEEGYIEVIGMGQAASEAAPIAIAAKHAAGVPANCAGVESNFFANGGVTPAGQGNMSNALTHQAAAAGEAAGYAGAGAVCITAASGSITASDTTLAGVCQNNYVPTDPNALKVSYFLRDAASGIEFGGNAVHVSGFNSTGQAWMTNQETGLFSGDVLGFDYPDLDGGPWIGLSPVTGDSATLRGLYDGLRSSTVLGSPTVLNDWSIATARNVSTDWVVTFPGQYTMLDYLVWIKQGFSTANCGQIAIPATSQPAVPLCDFRDIPVTAALTLYDREEGVITPASGNLVISPAPPGVTNALLLPNEVNVVEWTDGANTPVLGSAYATTVDASVLGDFGWASLAVSSTTDHGQSVCDFNVVSPETVSTARAGVCTAVTNLDVPMVGFVAWERSFPQNPDGNYGRLIDHSFSS
ncbi:MAG: hypothetical protein ACJASY_003682 [Halioglobus sp.]|jgi:hypothetical protein